MQLYLIRILNKGGYAKSFCITKKMNEDNMSFVKRIEVLPLFIQALMTDFKPIHDIKLKESEYRTLMQIKMNEGESMSFYSEKVGLENGSYTYLATKLENQGLIKRISSNEDKRKKIIILTDTGRELTDNIFKQFISQMTTKLNVLSDTEKIKLESAFIIIEESLDRLQEKSGSKKI